MALLLAACGRQEPAPPGQRRIVTITPALTHMVVDLGHGDEIVGVAMKDNAAPAGLPIVGNFEQIDYEKLLGLRPTHVLMQAGERYVPQRLRDLAARHGFALHLYDYPATLTEALDVLPALGRDLGVADEAAALRAAIDAKLRRIADVTARATPPRVLVLIGVGPTVMASGPGTVNDDLLKLVNAVNAAGEAGVPSPTYDREKLLALDPQVVVVMAAGGLSADGLGALTGLNVAAVRDARVVVLDDRLIFLPSTNVAGTALQLAKAVHPELAAELDRAVEAAP